MIMSTQHEEMLKRFDKKFELALEQDPELRGIGKEIKSFLISEIDLAVANREKEIVRIVKEKWSGRLVIPTVHIIDLIVLISKNI